VARPLATNDLIYLQNNQVSARVIRTMQEPPVQRPVVVQGSPPPVVVHEYYGAPCGYDYWGHPHHYRHYPPRVGIGFSYNNRH
jgi:hypothetical protein